MTPLLCHWTICANGHFRSWAKNKRPWFITHKIQHHLRTWRPLSTSLDTCQTWSCSSRSFRLRGVHKSCQENYSLENAVRILRADAFCLFCHSIILWMPAKHEKRNSEVQTARKLHKLTLLAVHLALVRSPFAIPWKITAHRGKIRMIKSTINEHYIAAMACACVLSIDNWGML